MIILSLFDYLSSVAEVVLAHEKTLEHKHLSFIPLDDLLSSVRVIRVHSLNISQYIGFGC